MNIDAFWNFYFNKKSFFFNLFKIIFFSPALLTVALEINLQIYNKKQWLCCLLLGLTRRHFGCVMFKSVRLLLLRKLCLSRFSNQAFVNGSPVRRSYSYKITLPYSSKFLASELLQFRLYTFSYSRNWSNTYWIRIY